jgi:hypothetical protein
LLVHELLELEFDELFELEFDEEFELELDEEFELEFDELFELEFDEELELEFEDELELELDELLELEFEELLPANCCNSSRWSCSDPSTAGGADWVRRILLMPPFSTLSGGTAARRVPAPPTAANTRASAVLMP